jgi:pimeloyl-ACP methyl ester carboxylesterase
MALTQLLRADPHYHDRGEGEPVVLVHGLFANLQLWAPIAGPLAQRHRVVTYDLPGHGQAPDVSTIEMSDLVQNLEALLDHLGLSVVHLGGISLGAMIALRFALDRPQRVATLTLADGFAGRLEDQYLDVFAGHARLAMDQGMQALFDHVLAHPALPIGPGLDLSPQTYEAHRQEFLKNRPETLAAYVAMMQRQKNWIGEL